MGCLSRNIVTSRDLSEHLLYRRSMTVNCLLKAANPAKADQLQKAVDRHTPSVEEMFAQIPARDDISAEATRISGSTALNDIAKIFPDVISGSADLHGSNKNYISGGGDFGGEPSLGKDYTDVTCTTVFVNTLWELL